MLIDCIRERNVESSVYETPLHRKPLSLGNSAVSSERPWKDLELFREIRFLFRNSVWGMRSEGGMTLR